MVFVCNFCYRFDANKGFEIHLLRRSLKTAVLENNKTHNKDVMDQNVYSGTQEQKDTILILKQEYLHVVRDVNSNQQPCYGLKDDGFVKIGNDYDGIITWTKNLFKLPSEKHPSCL